MPKYVTAGIIGLILALGSQTAFAKIKKVNVVGVPDTIERIAVNNGKCAASFFCVKKKTGLWTYHGRVKFRKGEVTLLDGTVLTGQVVLLQRRQDWKFVKDMALIVPEGEEDAIYVGPGSAFLITQEHKKGGTNTYDAYGSIYLKRRVSGPMRLSYNPTAGTSRSLASFLPANAMKNLQTRVAGREVMAAIKDGKNLADVRDSGTASQAMVDVISSIEITEKEYLVYDEANDTTSAITKGNFKETMRNIFAACPEADSKDAKKYSKSYKKIDEAFEYINATCTFTS
ncbi:hypothetical protein N9W89_06905 [Hellea sp.]|nr:hypothetical protein [Hellea sp.]